MYIKEIYLQHFRNYEEEKIILNPGINLFYGDNAQGKTNILESIFFCSMGKSFRAKKDRDVIQLNKKKARIETTYQKIDREGKIVIQIGEKKEIFHNGIKLKKLSELLGNIHVVIFSPDDIEIIKEGPQTRRRFLNMMISQLKPVYLYNLNLYNKALEQRNNYLRQIRQENKEESLLEIWDEKLAQYASIIFHYREEFVEKLKEKMKDIHNNITEGKESIHLEYHSDCKDREKYKEMLKKNRKLDIIRGYTSKGIHRDDFSVFINGKEVQVYGSQGQQRTVILSLKLAELYVVREEIGEDPILLLDDFMSELDEKRRKNFLENITDTQVLITATHKIILENLNYNVYNVKSGKIEKEN